MMPIDPLDNPAGTSLEATGLGASTPPPPPNKPGRGRSWYAISRRAHTIGTLAALFLGLIFLGIGIGFIYSQGHKKVAAVKGPAVENLSNSDLAKLGQIGTNLGTSSQVLNVSADALFRGQADVVGDLAVGGHLNANGPATLSTLNTTGATTMTSLGVSSNLSVTGTATLQKTLTVGGLATLASLTVSGATNVDSLNASTITVRSISITGPLTIGHLVTQGPNPGIAAGSVGGGGTVSISGNDTSGQININIGSSPGTSPSLATITFRAAFGSTVRIQLTPITAGAAAAQAWVVPSATGFTLHTSNIPQTGPLSFNYLVTQ